MVLENIKPGKNAVSFKSQDIDLAANIYKPDNFDESKKYPAVIFAGPFNQIKEQTGAVYGKKLAEKGFVFLCFDHTGYGESMGKIRNFENPFLKMENIRDGVSFLGTLGFVDKNNIFGLGICAGGGYMAIVAVTDKRLRAIASVSGMMDNKASIFSSMPREQVVSVLETANAARQASYETGNVEYYDGLGLESVDLATVPKDSAVYEGYDFYLTKRAGRETYPNYTHKAPANLMEYTPLTSANALAPYLYTPYLGIYGEKALADTALFTVDFFNSASEPKELFQVDGASHVSLYDMDEDVSRAVDKMSEFFIRHGKQ